MVKVREIGINWYDEALGKLALPWIISTSQTDNKYTVTIGVCAEKVYAKAMISQKEGHKYFAFAKEFAHKARTKRHDIFPKLDEKGKDQGICLILIFSAWMVSRKKSWGRQRRTYAKDLLREALPFVHGLFTCREPANILNPYNSKMETLAEGLDIMILNGENMLVITDNGSKSCFKDIKLKYNAMEKEPYFNPEQLAQLLLKVCQTGKVDQLNFACTGIEYNVCASGSKRVVDINDAEIKKAVRHVLSATNEKGERVMTDQRQWLAIFRVAECYCNYPTKITDFCGKVRTAGILDNMEDVPSCEACSIRKASSELPKLLNNKPSTWKQFASISKQYEKQWNVARLLMADLGLIEENTVQD